MSSGPSRVPGPPPQPRVLPTPQLPLSQLESLKFKANQIIESIHALAFTVGGGMNPAVMPAWPEVLSKYNVILSQTHNFSHALLNPYPTATHRAAGLSANAGPQENIYQKIVVHPNMGMPDSTLDAEVGPLLRNQQTIDVLKQENDTVRRLSDHMGTRGMLGVLGITEGTAAGAPQKPLHLNGYGGLNFQPPPKPEYEDVLRECAEIRDAHDHRVERAVRAVAMLRERFEWKQRVEVAVEEPEELEWDPRAGMHVNEDEEMVTDSGDDEEEEEEEEGGEDSNDEEEVNDIQGELVRGMEELDRQTPVPASSPVTIMPTTPAQAPLPAASTTPSGPLPQPMAAPMPATAPVAFMAAPVLTRPPASGLSAPQVIVIDDDEPQATSSNAPEIIDLT